MSIRLYVDYRSFRQIPTEAGRRRFSVPAAILVLQLSCPTADCCSPSALAPGLHFLSLNRARLRGPSYRLTRKLQGQRQWLETHAWPFSSDQGTNAGLQSLL